jgi:hypothetical protein
MIKKIGFIVLLIAVIGVCTGIYLWNKPHETVDDKKGVEITAVALSAEYGSNEQQANAKYLNKVIEVSGVVAETEQNQDGGTMVILEASDPMAGVQCAMREKGITVNKGGNVTIKGFCSGNGIMGVSLTDCIIKK